MKWSQDEIVFLASNIQSISVEAISSALGRTNRSVIRKYQELGISINPEELSKRRSDAARRLHTCGDTAEANPNWRGGISRDRSRYTRVQEQRYPERVAARKMAQAAIRSGKITKAPCEVCGCCVVDAHHDDYSRPLSVRFLCRKHHKLHHESLDRMKNRPWVGG